jgi:hypothetical protein
VTLTRSKVGARESPRRRSPMSCYRPPAATPRRAYAVEQHMRGKAQPGFAKCWLMTAVGADLRSAIGRPRHHKFTFLRGARALLKKTTPSETSCDVFLVPTQSGTVE